MKYLSFNTAILQAPEIYQSTQKAISIWFRATILCAFWENSGRLLGAVKWSDRQWIQAVGASKSEVLTLIKAAKTPKLIWAEGQDVIVWGYPERLEKEVQAKREGGKATVAKRWGNRSSATSSNIAEQQAAPIAGQQATPITEQQAAPIAHGIRNSNSNSNSNKYSNTTNPPTTDVVEEIYQAYPKHVGKKSALKAISKALEQIDAPSLLDRTRQFAEAVSTWPEARRKFRPDPATWFNAGRYEDDPAEWRLEKKLGSQALSGEVDPSFDPSLPNAHTGGIPLAN